MPPCYIKLKMASFRNPFILFWHFQTVRQTIFSIHKRMCEEGKKITFKHHLSKKYRVAKISDHNIKLGHIFFESDLL